MLYSIGSCDPYFIYQHNFVQNRPFPWKTEESRKFVICLVNLIFLALNASLILSLGYSHQSTFNQKGSTRSMQISIE